MTPDQNPYAYQLQLLSQKIAASRQLLADPELAELAQAELTQLEQEYQQLAAAAAQLDFNQDDDGSPQTEIINCIIEIRPGAGGDEAKIWASDLERMYLRYIESTALKVEPLDELVFKVKGRSEVTLPGVVPEATTAKSPTQASLDGSHTTAALDPAPTLLTAYQLLQLESGVHRVQRVPVTEAQGRVHTSTASVAVIPEVKKNAIEIKETDLEWQFMRAGGAGGQNVNKVNSAARLTHLPTGITVSSRRERSQAQNREIALEMLRGQLWELQEEQRAAQMGEARSVIGRAQRAEKIRTYNYPQNRVTDHRINESWYSLDRIMEGQLEDVLTMVRSRLIDR